MDEIVEMLRPHGSDDMVCKVWMEAMKTALPITSDELKSAGTEIPFYTRVDLALDVADAITNAFIERFRPTNET